MSAETIHEQAEHFRAHQRRQDLHPFTCGGGGGACSDVSLDVEETSLGVVLRCPKCRRTQVPHGGLHALVAHLPPDTKHCTTCGLPSTEGPWSTRCTACYHGAEAGGAVSAQGTTSDPAHEQALRLAADIFMSHLPNNNRATSDADVAATRRIVDRYLEALQREIDRDSARPLSAVDDARIEAAWQQHAATAPQPAASVAEVDAVEDAALVEIMDRWRPLTGRKWACEAQSRRAKYATLMMGNDIVMRHVGRIDIDHEGLLPKAFGHAVGDIVALVQKVDALIGTVATLTAEREALRADAERLRAAILWADGQGDDFRPRPEGRGPYWWRRELMERAGLAAREVKALAPTPGVDHG